MVKDPFLLLKKKMGLTVDLTTAHKGLSLVLEEEDEEASPDLREGKYLHLGRSESKE